MKKDIEWVFCFCFVFFCIYLLVAGDRSRMLPYGCQKAEMTFPQNLTETRRKEREWLLNHEWQSLGQDRVWDRTESGGQRRSSQR